MYRYFPRFAPIHPRFDTWSRCCMCKWFPVKTCLHMFFSRCSRFSPAFKTGKKELRTAMEISFFRETFLGYPWLSDYKKYFFPFLVCVCKGSFKVGIYCDSHLAVNVEMSYCTCRFFRKKKKLLSVSCLFFA